MFSITTELLIKSHGLVLSRNILYWIKTHILSAGPKMVFQDPKDPTTAELVLIKFMAVTSWKHITEPVFTPELIFLEQMLKLCQLR